MISLTTSFMVSGTSWLASSLHHCTGNPPQYGLKDQLWPIPYISAWCKGRHFHTKHDTKKVKKKSLTNGPFTPKVKQINIRLKETLPGDCETGVFDGRLFSEVLKAARLFFRSSNSLPSLLIQTQIISYS